MKELVRKTKSKNINIMNAEVELSKLQKEYAKKVTTEAERIVKLHGEEFGKDRLHRELQRLIEGR